MLGSISSGFGTSTGQCPLSVLDIGCNLGYFVFRMAERGGFWIGIDWGRNELMIAQATAYLNDVRNVAFSRIEVDEISVKRLPNVDMVICLSVFHHWVNRYGQKQALDMMTSLSQCAKKYLVFESGQPEEIDKPWSKKLSFMIPNGFTWIQEFLLRLGFNEVQSVGQFPTSVSDVPRDLFVAVRNSQEFSG